MVAKVGLDLSAYSMEGLRDNFFPIHLDPLLSGHTYTNQKIFEAIIAEKRSRFSKFELVPVDRKLKADPSHLKKDLRRLLRDMVDSVQYDEEAVAEVFQSPENQLKLRQFFEVFVVGKQITAQNFDAFYNRNISGVEDLVIINEQVFRSVRQIPEMGPTGNIEDEILASEHKIPTHVLRDQVAPSQPKIPFALVRDEAALRPEPALPDQTVQEHPIPPLPIVKRAKFGLNELKYQSNPISDKEFADKMVHHYQQFSFFTSFDSLSPWPLNKLFRVNPFVPWRARPEVLLHYFGQKITLYFKFTIFLLNYLFLFMFVGLALWIYEFVIWYFSDLETYYVLFGLRWAFVAMIIVWIGLLTYVWDTRMRKFRLATGISRSTKRTERVLFKSKEYERFLTTDEVNAKSQHALAIALKLLITFCIALLFYGAGFAVTIGLFYAKNAVIRSSMPVENYVYLNHNVINFFEIVRMMIWDFVFRRVAVVLMTKFVNPKYVEDYQNFLIYLLSFFTLFNHFFILMVILFFKGSMGSIGCAPLKTENGRSLFAVYLSENPPPNPNPGALSLYSVSGDCFFEATVYLKFYLIFRLLWSIGKAVVYVALKKKEEYARRRRAAEIRAVREQRDGIYSRLNALIESQVMLAPISESLDYDTTIVTFVDVS